MTNRRPRNPFKHHLFRQHPAEVIRRIRATARLHPAHSAYRQQMAIVDAAVFTHPDYPDLVDLAAAITHNSKGDPTR